MAWRWVHTPRRHNTSIVPANFEQEDWLAKLVGAGFDLSQPALFIWEGVTPYLNLAAIQAALRKIASTAVGSMVAFDYFTTEVLELNAFYMRYARAGTWAAGEPLKFGIDSTPPTRERLAERIQSCGLTLLEQRTLGQESGGKRAWGNLTSPTAPSLFSLRVRKWSVTTELPGPGGEVVFAAPLRKPYADKKELFF